MIEISEEERRAWAELRRRTVSSGAGDGKVAVTANGALEIVGVKIDPSALDPRDVATLQDQIRAATNSALLFAQMLQREVLEPIERRRRGIDPDIDFARGSGRGGAA